LSAEIAWHSKDSEEVAKILNTSPEGLDEEEVRRRLERYGPNELVAEKRISPIKILLRQFRSILIVILIAAIFFSALIGEVVDALVILAIVLAATILGFFQEYRAERALEALKEMLAPTITALRGGVEKEVPSKDLVPGDVILVEAGDKIPADGKLFMAVNLQVDEAPLTGESLPVSKSVGTVSEDTEVADRKNMIFSGTIATYGKGKAFVTGTAMATELGKTAKAVMAVTEEKTPLEKRMEDVGKWLGSLALVVCIAVVGIALLRSYFTQGVVEEAFVLEMVLFGIALAVAAVPEALPAIVTAALAIGMREMAKRNALIRRMAAVETLGCTTVICSDKTGTLTKGEMTVRRIFADGRIIQVTGSGYEPKGELRPEDGPLDATKEPISLFMKASILCSDARIEEAEGKWRVSGDPTEGALIVVAEKAGFNQNEVRKQCPRIAELPFSSERKRNASVHLDPVRGKIVYVKGAPEVVLERSTHVNLAGKVERLTEEKRDEILKVNERMAGDALRVLGLAYKDLPAQVEEFTEENLESGLVFLGLVGMMDPPRAEAAAAVKLAKGIKMKPVMITGDHKLTAVAIAKEMGIFSEGDMVLTGAELEKMSDEEFARIVDKVTVYARVSPIHKLRIVKAWRARGQVVAMTGDGVNDAPAVKQASIGIAMGVTGTEVTKEASDMVLTDDNFATIVKAVELGRWIYDNIKKYLTFLLRANLVEIIVIGGGVLVGLPLPLLAVQILYVNLATDGLPAIALGISPPDPDLMQRPPRDPKESIFSREVKMFLIITPLIIAPILLWVFISSLAEGLEVARTELFLLFIFVELTVAFNCRSLRYPLFRARPHKLLLLAVGWEILLLSILISIPAVRVAFGMVAPTFYEWETVLGICLFVLVALEVLKIAMFPKLVRARSSTQKL